MTTPFTEFPKPIDRHIRRGQPEYAHALSMLLPQGIAWPRWPETVLMKVVYGLAGIFGWADGRAADLLERESDPRQATDVILPNGMPDGLLDDWERNWGLPDPCYAGPLTIGERQRHLVLRMTLLGAQSRAFFIGVGKFLGYDNITISEYRPFMVGIDRAGDNREYLPDGSLGEWPCQIGDPVMRFAWTIHVADLGLVWFRASRGQAGIDPHLRITLALDLECVIRRWRPAHTEVLFDYSGAGLPGDPMAGTP